MFIDVVQKNIPSAFRNNNNTILVLPTNDMQIQLIYKLNKQLDDNLGFTKKHHSHKQARLQ